jgi:hypothetical protein
VMSISIFESDGNAKRNVSLRGAERRSNLNNNEIATPCGLAMTCQNIKCVSIIPALASASTFSSSEQELT